METKDTLLRKLKPMRKHRVIDLVADAGFDVSDWANFEGGPLKAGANPKYCYEWSFQQESLCLLNIWYENLSFDENGAFQTLNFRSRPSDISGVRRLRAARFEKVVKEAFEEGRNLRVIILDRSHPSSSGATARLLDDDPWTVTQFDYATGAFELRRGAFPNISTSDLPEEMEEFPEGEERRRFGTHRHRERALRAKKIAQHKLLNKGKVICEVPGCGFDFALVYGEIGQDYAQVHHLTPLSQVDKAGVTNAVDDLAVVCANCHVMIHRGGASRPLDGLINQKG
jgi:putative restriction endonuclease